MVGVRVHPCTPGSHTLPSMSEVYASRYPDAMAADQYAGAMCVSEIARAANVRRAVVYKRTEPAL